MIKPNAVVEVNLKNLAYNYKALSDLANQSICAATIKANAYGLGVIKTFEILYKKNCRHFFVATTEEALEIMIVCYEKLGLSDLRINAQQVLAANYPNNALVAK